MDVADIDRMMAGDLGQWLGSQTAVRAEAKRNAWIRLPVGLILCCVIGYLLVWVSPNWRFEGEWELRVALAVCIFVIPPIAAFAPYWRIKEDIKRGINAAIADQLGVEYSESVAPGSTGRGAGWEPARLYRLVPSYNKSSFEDCWSGEIAGHDFRLFEATLSQESGSGKNRSSRLMFRGAIVQMAFGRPFRSTTLLQRKGAIKGFDGLFGSADSFKKGGHQLDLVEQVHPLFEGTFDIYSDDQVEARVLMHPAYLEKLLEIERAFFGSKARALFHDGLVVIAIDSGNLFESGGMDARKDRELVERTVGQFAALTQLALAFNQTHRGRALDGPQA